MALTHPAGMSEPEGTPPAPPQGDGNGRVTPVMEQYIEIKAANPDCLLFYRMGDFYELFFEDAETASRALGIVLTKRGKHHGQDIPMCGVPVIRADEYLHRLIALGHRVAVCEQLEDPAEARKRGSKSVVRRDVIRLVTPGTITEGRLLEPGRTDVASIADPVLVEVGLHGVGDRRTLVAPVGDPVAVLVGGSEHRAVLAGVVDAVRVAIDAARRRAGGTRRRCGAARIADVADAVAVGILLPRVRDPAAVVVIVGDAVLIGVEGLIERGIET